MKIKNEKMAEYTKLKMHNPKRREAVTGRTRNISRKSALRLLRDCLLAGIITYILFGQIFGIAFAKGEPGAEAGKLIVYNRLDKKPKINDTAIFAAFGRKRYLAGRVIATSGDKVDINGESGELVVSGNHDKLSFKIKNTADGRGTIEYPTTVPIESIFVLGGDSEKASDSRRLGVINLRRVAGTALFIFKLP